MNKYKWFKTSVVQASTSQELDCLETNLSHDTQLSESRKAAILSYIAEQRNHFSRYSSAIEDTQEQD